MHTDPAQSGWFYNDPYKGEIGDLCNFDSQGHSTDTVHTINGHQYTLQAEWSDTMNACESNGS